MIQPWGRVDFDLGAALAVNIAVGFDHVDQFDFLGIGTSYVGFILVVKNQRLILESIPF